MENFLKKQHIFQKFGSFIILLALMLVMGIATPYFLQLVT